MDRLTELSLRYLRLFEENVSRKQLSTQDLKTAEEENRKFWLEHSKEMILGLANESSLKTAYYGVVMPVDPLNYVRMTALYSHRILIQDFLSMDALSGMNIKIASQIAEVLRKDLYSLRRYVEEGIVVITPRSEYYLSDSGKQIKKIAEEDYNRALRNDLDVINLKRNPRVLRSIGHFILESMSPEEGKTVAPVLEDIKRSTTRKEMQELFNQLMLMVGDKAYADVFGKAVFEAVDEGLTMSDFTKSVLSTEDDLCYEYMKLKLKYTSGRQSTSLDEVIVSVLPNIGLWYLKNLSDDEILKIRSKSSEFYDLREDLRDIFRRLQDAKPMLKDVRQQASEARAIIESDLKEIESRRKIIKGLYGAGVIQGMLAAGSLLLGLTPIDVLLGSSMATTSIISGLLGYTKDSQEKKNSLYLFWKKHN